jgi:hypothetical protein
MSERSHRAICHLVPRLLFIGLLIIDTASGEAVYKWRDEHEVTHFSQKPPRKLPQDLEIIELDAPRPAPHALADYYSVINQARRMEEDRRKRERENLLRKLALQQARLESDNEYHEDDATDTTYIPVYGYYRYPSRAYPYRYPYGKYPPRPGHGYRPHHAPFPGTHTRAHPRYSNRTRTTPPAILNLGR